MTDEVSSRNNLGPRDFRALIVDTLRIYKERFFPIVAIVAVAQVPYAVRLLLERAYRSGQGITFEELAETGLGIQPAAPETPVTFLLDIVSSILFLVMYGAIAHIVAQHIARPTINVREAYRYAMRRLLPMIGTEIIIVVTGGAGLLAGVFLAIQLFSLASFRTITIFLVATIGLVAIYAGVHLFAVFAIVLFEHRSPLAALKGSLRLVQGHWWWVLSVLAAAFIISTMAFVIGLLLGATIWPVWQIALEFLSILSIPISIILATLLYFDLRVRSDGYGLDTLAAELEVGRSAGPR